MAQPPPPPSGAERRQHGRKSFRSVAQLRLSQQAPVIVRTLDISASGLGIVGPLNLAAGTMGVVQFVLPKKTGGGTRVELEAMVIHSVFSNAEGGFKTGLQFGTIPPEAAQTIVRFIGGG